MTLWKEEVSRYYVITAGLNCQPAFLVSIQNSGSPPWQGSPGTLQYMKKKKEVYLHDSTPLGREAANTLKNGSWQRLEV